MAAKYVFKFIVVGDSSVGKTSLINRLTRDDFNPGKTVPTIGIDMFHHQLTLNNEVIKFVLWDTAGYEAFRSLTASYYRAAAGVLMVFDVTNAASFNSLVYWLEECHKNSDPTTQVILIGNKSDLWAKRAVEEREVQAFAAKHGLSYVETSALSGENVTRALIDLAQKVYQKIQSGEIDVRDPKSGARLNDEGLGAGFNLEETPRETGKVCNCV